MSQRIPHRLIQDDDCHWYVIAVSDEDDFWEWVEACEKCTALPGRDFNDNRVDGPHSVEFYDWKEQE